METVITDEMNNSEVVVTWSEQGQDILLHLSN